MLNTRYIATHTTTLFSNYFDPRLLHDLANDLHIQVVSCNSDGLRYAFILDRGQIDMLPTHIEFPFLDGDKLFVRVVYSDKPVLKGMEQQITPVPPVAAGIVDDQMLIQRGVKAFLKVLDDIALRDVATAKLSTKDIPTIVAGNADEFNKRVAQHRI